MKLFFFLKSLINFIKLFIVILFLFCPLILFAAHLNIDNNDLYCDDDNCKLLLKDNQSVDLLDKDGKYNIFGLFENGILNGYYFYTADIVDIPAYSGKPLDILILLDKYCYISELKLIKHSEPILMTGIPVEKLLEAVCFYKGKNIQDDINIGDDKSGGLSVPIIAGATVTSFVLHKTILDSSRKVAIYNNLMDQNNFFGKKINDLFVIMDWDELLKSGIIKNLKVLCNDLYKIKEKKNKLLVDIYFVDIFHPIAGKNIFGEAEYLSLLDELKSKNFKSAILILNKGKWSFKGNAFVRGGIFDRFTLKQGFNQISFRDSNYIPLYYLDIANISEFREHGIFGISDENYDLSRGFDFSILISYMTSNVNYKNISINYKLPDICYQDVHNDSNILKAWKNKLYYIIIYLLLWIFVITIFILRDKFANNKRVLSYTYIFVLLLSIYIIGYLQAGQPSIVNVFAITKGFTVMYNVFILDAFIFCGWLMILLTTILWGRSLFCGWICPFGALQELLFKIRSFFYKSGYSFELASFLRNRLKYLRYVILIFLILVSFYSMYYAELFAEIEPFKTIWNVGIFSRSEFYFSLYCLLLLSLSLFTYRIFCRFLCPLGGFLSFLSILQIFEIKRRDVCGKCKICEKECSSFAINSLGEINNFECYACFTCISNMNNNELCPPLIKPKLVKRYAKN